MIELARDIDVRTGHVEGTGADDVAVGVREFRLRGVRVVKEYRPTDTNTRRVVGWRDCPAGRRYLGQDQDSTQVQYNNDDGTLQ